MTPQERKAEQDYIDALDKADTARCLVCGKSFKTVNRTLLGPLRGGSIGLAHSSMTGHEVTHDPK